MLYGNKVDSFLLLRFSFSSELIKTAKIACSEFSVSCFAALDVPLMI